jgi:hypothetical protein
MSRVDAVLKPLGHKIPDDWKAFGISITNRHVVWGNTKAAAGPVEIRSDQRWLQEMQPPQRVLVSLIESPLLLRYGYFASNRQPHP